MSIAFWPAIQQVSGGPFGSPAPLTRDSQWTIAQVDGSSGNQYVELPSGCDIGDVVEIHNDGSAANFNPQASCPSGETFSTGGPIVSGPKFFRKIASTVWGALG